ncbi:NADH-quinone oxidoreductase subunit NuoG [Parachlamydia sp. AcF125]|uniref:NADH-quinone oxidoreductase subunit NuoG n=1 Tax=Parachlamydia sp. AcF125 TaxID=2795736 RepID=UPI00201651C1|nr:NADH-quinone oxidoreductase subunit NuoG [Parachlamydia sp. AcF125]
MINLTIDGQTVSVPKGTTVYKAIKQLGIEVPVFCYQDRMPPFGACRVCLVEVEKMAKLQTSCTLEATEGMVVHTQADKAVEGRKSILEFLLINHPLDCPICDKGGECPLQDQTLKFGPGESQFFEEKRHFKKALPLGHVLMLDRERCIACARCTRFGEVIAGDHALQFVNRGYRTEVGTPGQGPVQSKFIGNTIQICPVGALTSQVYRFRARPWDNDSTNSACTLCPVGCSLTIDARDGQIMRIRSQENLSLNDMWLCDKGWFGYEFASHPHRLQAPLIRKGDKLEPTTWDQALSLIAEKLSQAKPQGKLAAWGGNPLTLEENYLLQKLMREGAGVHHLDHRIGMPIMPKEEEGASPGMEGTVGECEELAYALLLGFDLTEEFPVIWLRLKQALNRGAIVHYFGHYAPEIASQLQNVVIHPPGEEVEMIQQAKIFLERMAEKGPGAIFVGTQYLATPHRAQIVSQLIKIRRENPSLSLNVMEGRGNSMGARLAGMRPDRGPFEGIVENSGMNAIQVLEKAAQSGWDFLYVVGADPAIKFPSTLWKECREKLNFLVVQDLFLTKTALQADLVLPALSFVEKKGSFINIEGRVQKLSPGKEIPSNLYSDGEIFMLIAQHLGQKLTVDIGLEDSLKTKILSSYRNEDLHGSEVSFLGPLGGNSFYATFAHALFDKGNRMKHNPHLIHLAKEPFIRINPLEGQRRGLMNGDQVKISARGNTIVGQLKLDKNVAQKTVVLPLGFPQLPVHELGVNLLNGLIVEISKEVL